MTVWKRLFGSGRRPKGLDSLRRLVERFRELVGLNNKALELIADMGDKMSGDYLFDSQYLNTVVERLDESVRKIVLCLNDIGDHEYPELFDAFETARGLAHAELESRAAVPRDDGIIPISELSRELSDSAGAKMAALGELPRLGLKIPEGFAITAWACRRYFEHNGIDGDAFFETAAKMDPHEQERAAHKMRARVLRGTFPPEIGAAMREALLSLKGEGGLAVRSSAIGEDGASSYAGLYRTVLNVQPEQVPGAYQRVLASLFTQRLLAYRSDQPGQLRSALMAVGVMRMVPAEISGVCYSLNPSTPDRERMVVSAAWGLGKSVVEGEGGVDQFELSKTPPFDLLSSRIGRKETSYVAADEGGLRLEPVPEARRQKACLDAAVLSRLGEAALRIEGFMRCFQDIEWALDAKGELYFLQARPLHIIHGVKERRSEVASAVQDRTALLRGRGVVACRGVAAGPVFVVDDQADMRAFPRGAVLVAKHASPRLSKLLSRAAAVITDSGVVTGHLATVAREFRVPAILDAGNATKALAQGLDVTVDAEENVVYEGTVREILRLQLYMDDPYEDAPEFRILRRLLKRIAPLRLTSPNSPEFTARNCVTYHDIIRYAHETAVRELTSALDPGDRKQDLPSRRLRLNIPLDLLLIDLGDAIEDSGGAEIGLGQLACAPLGALLRSLTAPGVWRSNPVDLDFSGFMSSMTRTAATTPKQAAGGNIAVVSAEYMHLSLRLGYHFNLVDSFWGPDRNSNYIYFRFLGGVTDLVRRSRRARLLAAILERYDFAAEVKGDLVLGRADNLSAEQMEHHLGVIGRIIGFTRQLDVLLRSDSSVEEYAEKFFKESPLPEGGGDGRGSPGTAQGGSGDE